jgi:carboxylesterase type B
MGPANIAIGSIMHHLVGNRGATDPLFKQAIMQSPAFEPMYSPEKLEATYDAFEKAVGCAGEGLACLRTKTTAELQTANLAIVGDAQYGTFGFGPTVDNQYIYDLPLIEMANGNYWKDVSVIVGHNSNEGIIFADPSKIFNSQVDEVIKNNFPNMMTANTATLESLYPDPSILGPFLTNFARLSQLIGDYVVTCNVRAIAKAYAGNVWAYQFSVPPGIHAFDLIFTFWR